MSLSKCLWYVGFIAGKILRVFHLFYLGWKDKGDKIK